MKRVLGTLLLMLVAFQLNAQTNSTLLKHYEEYYKQMKAQGDVQGVVNALTHLNILAPSEARKDTLAVLYMNQGSHIQALNTIGIEPNKDDSDMAVEVKAVCLQELGQAAKAIPHFEELFKRSPNVLIAYELTELKIQTDDISGAKLHLTFGKANMKKDIMRTYYDGQGNYQVPIEAAFLYLESLIKFKENPEANKDAAIAILDKAIAVAPNFNLALVSKQAIEAQKNTPPKQN